jgi:NAD(P)-dependent dehydrogenase (short-subunit alcohol dehydrogenase family)
MERQSTHPSVPGEQAAVLVTGSYPAEGSRDGQHEPADTAGLVAFLASDDAGFITGQIIYNSGGQRGPIRWTR